jgi:lectin-like protein
VTTHVEGTVHELYDGRMRLAVASLALCACHARLSGGGNAPDGGPTGDVRPSDSAVDAKPCTGGDARTSDGDGNCFVWFLGPKTWVDAKAACEALPGTHLATIKNADQNQLIADMIVGYDTFLGGNDRATEGTWVWDDGTPWGGYTNWRSGVPDNGGNVYQEDCLIMEGKKTPDNTWDDRPCDPSEVPTSGSFAYLCKN